MADAPHELTADLVFRRLEELREVLRLTDYLAGFRPAAPAGELEQARIGGHDVAVLYRPTGAAEMALLEASAFRRWPARLPEQPIFYPVTNERYAREIAERWNARDEGVAYVTRFYVHTEIAREYEIHVVGARHHTELWIPAEDLEAFNDAIVGPIEVIARIERAR
jgi:hypothetical protein